MHVFKKRKGPLLFLSQLWCVHSLEEKFSTRWKSSKPRGLLCLAGVSVTPLLAAYAGLCITYSPRLLEGMKKERMKRVCIESIRKHQSTIRVSIMQFAASMKKRGPALSEDFKWGSVWVEDAPLSNRLATIALKSEWEIIDSGKDPRFLGLLRFW